MTSPVALAGLCYMFYGILQDDHFREFPMYFLPIY